MQRDKTWRQVGLWCLVFLLILAVAALEGKAREAKTVGIGDPFPAFGTGPVEVRLYTDYFCPPCRSLDPVVQPLLRALLLRSKIRLIMVDVPHARYSILYACHFLYALHAKHDLEQAFRARNALIEASLSKETMTQEQLGRFLSQKGIDYERLDPKPFFEQYNTLLKEDKINATPTCVIVRNGEKQKAVGSEEILRALKQLT